MRLIKSLRLPRNTIKPITINTDFTDNRLIIDAVNAGVHMIIILLYYIDII